MSCGSLARGLLAVVLVWWGAQVPIELLVAWYSGAEDAAAGIPAWLWARAGVECAACWLAAAALLSVPAR